MVWFSNKKIIPKGQSHKPPCPEEVTQSDSQTTTPKGKGHSRILAIWAAGKGPEMFNISSHSKGMGLEWFSSRNLLVKGYSNGNRKGSKEVRGHNNRNIQ